MSRQVDIDQRGDLPTCPLKYLNISNNEIHDDGIISLSKAMSSSVSFTEEEQQERKKNYQQQNNTSNKNVLFIPSRPNPTIDLITLDLHNNRIKSRGAVALSSAIRENPTITYLNVSNNRIGFQYSGSKYEKSINYNKTVFNYDTSGSMGFSQMMDDNIGTLTHLDLSCNGIDSVGGTALLESLQWSEWIETFNLSGNEMSTEIVEEQNEIGDPRLDLSFQKRMRIKGMATVNVPTRISETITNETVGTGGLSVAGNSRSYHAGGTSKSKTDYHYQSTRWSEKTRMFQLKKAREKYLPIDNDKGTEGKEGKEGGKEGEGKESTPLQIEWKKMMKGNHSVQSQPLHTEDMLMPPVKEKDTKK